MSEPLDNGVDDVWGAASPGGTPRDSAFSEPSLVTDVSARETHEEHEFHGGGDDQSQHSGGDATAAPKSKPNFLILAVVGLVGVAVIAGAGFVVTKNFSNKRSSPSNASVFASAAEVPIGTSSNVGSAGASVFAEPPKGVAAGVFDTPSSTSTAGASSATMAAMPSSAASASPGATAVPQVEAAKVITPEKGVPVKPLSGEALAQASASKFAAPAMASAAPSVATPGTVSPAVVTKPGPTTRPVLAAATPSKATPVIVSKSTLQKEKSGHSLRVEASAKSGRSTMRVASSHTPRAARNKARERNKKTVMADNRAAAEVFLLPAGIKVRSIYPMSGKNVQAWLADGSGRLEIVRVGENLRSGAQVISIKAENGEVVTSSGTITSRGVSQ